MWKCDSTVLFILLNSFCFSGFQMYSYCKSNHSLSTNFLARPLCLIISSFGSSSKSLFGAKKVPFLTLYSNLDLPNS